MTLEELFKDREIFVKRVMPYVKCYDVAEDVVQNAFIKAFIYKDKYDETRASLKTWFNKILYSCVWDAKKKPKIKTVDIDEFDDKGYVEEYDNLETFVENITNPFHRKVLTCFHIYGYSPLEISLLLDTSESNVRKIIERFRRTV